MNLEMFAVWEQEDLSFQISILSNNAPAQTQAMNDSSSNIRITLYSMLLYWIL